MHPDDPLFPIEDLIEPQPVRCRYCGKEGLELSQTDKGWRLLNEVGNPHTCNPRMLFKEQSGVFDDLDA